MAAMGVGAGCVCVGDEQGIQQLTTPPDHHYHQRTFLVVCIDFVHLCEVALEDFAPIIELNGG